MEHNGNQNNDILNVLDQLDNMIVCSLLTSYLAKIKKNRKVKINMQNLKLHRNMYNKQLLILDLLSFLADKLHTLDWVGSIQRRLSLQL